VATSTSTKPPARLPDQLDDVRDFINNDSKTAVRLLAELHPKFVKGFEQANRTTDRKGARKAIRNKAGSTPPPDAAASS
jgi:hypothetical protein